MEKTRKFSVRNHKERSHLVVVGHVWDNSTKIHLSVKAAFKNLMIASTKVSLFRKTGTFGFPICEDLLDHLNIAKSSGYYIYHDQ